MWTYRANYGPYKSGAARYVWLPQEVQTLSDAVDFIRRHPEQFPDGAQHYVWQLERVDWQGNLVSLVPVMPTGVHGEHTWIRRYASAFEQLEPLFPRLVAMNDVHVPSMTIWEAQDRLDEVRRAANLSHFAQETERILASLSLSGSGRCFIDHSAAHCQVWQRFGNFPRPPIEEISRAGRTKLHHDLCELLFGHPSRHPYDDKLQTDTFPAAIHVTQYDDGSQAITFPVQVWAYLVRQCDCDVDKAQKIVDAFLNVGFRRFLVNGLGDFSFYFDMCFQSNKPMAIALIKAAQHDPTLKIPLNLHTIGADQSHEILVHVVSLHKENDTLNLPVLHNNTILGYYIEECLRVSPGAQSELLYRKIFALLQPRLTLGDRTGFAVIGPESIIRVDEENIPYALWRRHFPEHVRIRSETDPSQFRYYTPLQWLDRCIAQTSKTAPEFVEERDRHENLKRIRPRLIEAIVRAKRFDSEIKHTLRECLDPWLPPKEIVEVMLDYAVNEPRTFITVVAEAGVEA